MQMECVHSLLCIYSWNIYELSGFTYTHYTYCPSRLKIPDIQ
jgi:hypothetical protein